MRAIEKKKEGEKKKAALARLPQATFTHVVKGGDPFAFLDITSKVIKPQKGGGIATF